MESKMELQKKRSNYKPENHVMETRICDCPDHEEFACIKSSKQKYIGGHNRKGKISWNKGKKGVMPTPWNKNLTKETDKRVREYAEKIKGANSSSYKPELHVMETRVCKCGCGGTFECEKRSKQKCINRHQQKGVSNLNYKSEFHILETRYCACGCGKTFECPTVSKKRFVSGHQPEGKDSPNYNPALHIIETRVCECNCGGAFQCEAGSKQRFINGHQNRGKKNGMYGRKGDKCPSFGKIRAKETREKIRENVTKRFSDPKEREDQSKRTTESWQDPEIARRMMSVKCPNKTELRLNALIQSVAPGEFALNVRANIMTLGGKVPDFVNVNGKKKLIELFGNWYHSKEFATRNGIKYASPEDRINYFKKFGWDTLVVWEHELKGEKVLINKIGEFLK